MKIKLLWLVCLFALAPCAASAQSKGLRAQRVKNPRVAYAPASKVRTFPFPVVNFVREGLARPTDVQEIMDGIVYPLVNQSPKPVAAFVITFDPDSPDLGVLVLWHDSSFADMLVRRDARGRVPPDSYKMFLQFEQGEP
jgi:hypothetical protein